MKNNILFVMTSLIFIGTNAYLRNDSILSPVIVAANYNELYTGNVYSNKEYIFVYNRVKNNFPKETRVTVESNATSDFPLTVIIKQKAGVLYWNIPFLRNSNYSNTSRTLCSSNINSTNEEETVTVTLSTSSNVGIGFKLKLLSVKDFQIRTSEVRNNIRISPSEPVYYRYSFDERSESKSVIVHLKSDSEICMIFSIQKKSCPVLDLEKNVENAEYWQTVSSQGAITVSKENFPDGFFIILIAKFDDYKCSGVFDEEPSKSFLSSNLNMSHRVKFVTLSIKPGKRNKDYIIACISFASVILAFGILFIASSILYYTKTLNTLNVSYSVNHLENCTLNRNDEVNLKNTSTENSTTCKELLRQNLVIYVCDLSQKESVYLKERSRLYMYYLVTVSVFYILPVMQLLATNQIILQESGNQDLCYYNFLCAQPFGFLSAFNNVFSNLGYTLFGLLFILITRVREAYNTINKYTFYGIPQHYGLFYAMGIALMMEGVLSASYHFCPSYNNFQFDTSFMYIITVLCMVKIYQIRHPDVHARAPVTFGVLALMIFLALIGVLDGSFPFWIIFTVIHLTFFSILIAEVYSLGKKRFHGGLFATFCTTLKNDFYKIREDYSCASCLMKFAMFLLSIVSNIGLAIYSNFFYNKDFAMYLLAILMLNLLLYLSFYGFMKLCENERILFQPAIFIILSILTWSGAFYFYFKRTTSWDLTAAQSRNYNKPCLLFNFFDNHDIWHFLSALAMFFSFMILLTIDDDLNNVPRNQILVF